MSEKKDEKNERKFFFGRPFWFGEREGQSFKERERSRQNIGKSKRKRERKKEKERKE